MPPRGVFGSGSGGGGGGGTNSSFTTPERENLPVHGVDYETDASTLPGSLAGGSGIADDVNAVIGGPIVPDVLFDADYGGTGVRFDGYDLFGVEQTQTLTAGAGTRVHGSKVFTKFTSITTVTPGGAVDKLARIQIRKVVCVSHIPVASFVAVYNDVTGGLYAVATEDKTNGWVALTDSGHPALGDQISIEYTWAHTHTIT